MFWSMLCYFIQWVQTNDGKIKKTCSFHADDKTETTAISTDNNVPKEYCTCISLIDIGIKRVTMLIGIIYKKVVSTVCVTTTLPIWHQTPINQSINQTINQSINV